MNDTTTPLDIHIAATENIAPHKGQPYYGALNRMHNQIVHESTVHAAYRLGIDTTQMDAEIVAKVSKKPVPGYYMQLVQLAEFIVIGGERTPEQMIPALEKLEEHSGMYMNEVDCIRYISWLIFDPEKIPYVESLFSPHMELIRELRAELTEMQMDDERDDDENKDDENNDDENNDDEKEDDEKEDDEKEDDEKEDDENKDDEKEVLQDRSARHWASCVKIAVRAFAGFATVWVAWLHQK